MATQAEDMMHGYNSRHELMDTAEVVLGDDCQLVLGELDKQNKVHVRLFNSLSVVIFQASFAFPISMLPKQWGTSKTKAKPLPSQGTTTSLAFSTELSETPCPSGLTALTDTQVQHTRCANVGKGGHLAQLEKVGQAIEGPSKPSRFEVTISADKPVNPMAPTPHCPKRRTVTSDSTEVPTLVPASAEHLTDIPAVTAVNGAPGRCFGLQLQAPPPPMFVGSQSVDAFEHGCKNVSANNMDLGCTWNHKSQWSTAIPAQAPAPLPQSNQIHDKATSEPDGWNSPNQSEKLSKMMVGMVLMEWDNTQDEEHLDQDLYDNPPPEHQEQHTSQYQANPSWAQLFNDTQTFCSDVKKAIMKTLLFDYELYPLSSAGNEEAWIKFVKDKADELLRTSVYLHGKPDTLNYILYNALMLVVAIMLSVHTYRGLEGQVDHILGNPYHGPKLDRMLEEWAMSGMTGYTTKTGGITETSCDEFNVI
ncbi:hypothetical protein J3A83DRAFT_4191349 [Scleroderma citrinum]